jgi:uncharacterized protein with NAD-binding domain and iron-sulfur cluster
MRALSDGHLQRNHSDAHNAGNLAGKEGYSAPTKLFVSRLQFDFLESNQLDGRRVIHTCEYGLQL